MSATTLLESFDTQMDYSGDLDVAMHPAGSSDPWPFHGESITMDQDSHPDSHSSAITNRDESVEVDMEDSSYLEYTGHEHAEYEMVDEDSHFQQEGVELLDVEVYDAATDEPSPASMPLAYDAPQLSAIPSVEYTFESSPSITDVAIIEAHALPTEAHPDPQTLDGPAASIPLVSVNTAGAVGDARNAEYTSTAAIDGEASVLSTSAEEHVEATALAPELLADEPHGENLAEYSAVEPAFSVEETGHIPQSAAVPAHTGVEADTISVAETPAIPVPAAENVFSEHEENAAEEDTEHPHAGEVHEDSHEETGNRADEASAQEITNPLEPGFGVDPPPPIHLSFGLADLAEVYLFNRPSDGSGSRTPQDGNVEVDTTSIPVLLHHRPLLYFATLDQVFTALREEEYIAQIPQITEGEIILDAYDLQLVITESLRDQIDRLNIARETSEHPEEAAHNRTEESEEEHHDERAQESAVEHAYRENEQTASDAEDATTNLEATGDDLDSSEADQEAPHGLDGAGQPFNVAPEEPAPSTEQVADHEAAHDSEEEDYDAASQDQSAHESEEYIEGEDYDDSHEEAGDEERKSHEEHFEGLHGTDSLQALGASDAPAASEQLSIEVSATEEDPPLAGGELEHGTEGEQTDHDENSDSHGDESDINFVALLEQEADLPENEAEGSTPVQQETPQLNAEPEYPELEDDPEWDDDLDAEGEIDTTWAADNDDGDSNESTVTLSSTATVPKRTYDEFDSDVDEDSLGPSPETISPGLAESAMADAETARLCVQIIHSQFGPLTANVASVLLTRGRLPLPHLVRFTSFKPRSVRQAIIVLVQHNIVWHAMTEDEGEVLEVNTEECLTRLRFGRYVWQTEQLFGTEGAEIVQAILDHGKLRPPDILSKLPAHHPEGPDTYTKVLYKLVTSTYLKPSTILSHISPRDKRIKYEGEEKAKISGFPTAKELRQARETAEARLKKEEADAEKAGLKVKVAKPGPRGVKRKAEPEEVVDDEVFFRVNYDKFNIHIRNKIIEMAARERFNESAALVIRATLKATETKQLGVSDVKSDPTSIANISMQLSDDTDLSQGLILKSSKKSSNVNLLKDYIGMLSSTDNPTPAGRAASFLSMVGSKVQVEFEIVCRRLRRRVLEAVTRERHGEDGVRLLRLLLNTGKMDEKQISKVAMLAPKEARPLLSAMSSESLVSIQEVPKSADRNPTRTFYLWYVDLQKAYSVLLGSLYKTLYNISVRRRAEEQEQSLKAVLEKRERSDVSEDESLLTRMERETLQQWEAKKEKLTVLEMRVEEAVFILRDLGALGISDE
ncbi:hypothetical protein HWV62_23943 [Athelia sp. TMB]|nr:hypothetical protein HWV62_23943 [Athelia sp. TMB]